VARKIRCFPDKTRCFEVARYRLPQGRALQLIWNAAINMLSSARLS
jgi:hypothetical protein